MKNKGHIIRRILMWFFILLGALSLAIGLFEAPDWVSNILSGMVLIITALVEIIRFDIMENKEKNE